MASGLSDLLRDIDFQDFFRDLDSYGWFEYVFPFLLVYAVVFTILNQVKLFEDKKPVKVIIAMVFGLFSVAFPVSDYGTLGDLLSLLFPKVTAVTMGILGLYIVAAMLGVDLVDFLGKDNNNNNIIRYILGALGLGIIAYYFGIGMDWWSDDFRNLWIIDLITDPLLWVVVVFAFFFWYISKDDENANEKYRKWLDNHPDATDGEKEKKRKQIIGD